MLKSVFSFCLIAATLAAGDSLVQAAELDTRLLKAIKLNDIGFIEKQLAKGLDSDHRIKSETLLMIAAREGREALVSMLVDKGADVNAKSAQGHNAMSFSSRYGYLEIVQYLLNHGAEVNITNNNNWTPLLKAARGGHLEVVDYLLAHEADINSRNSGGQDAVALARRYGHKKVMNYLKDYRRRYK